MPSDANEGEEIMAEDEMDSMDGADVQDVDMPDSAVSAPPTMALAST